MGAVATVVGLLSSVVTLYELCLKGYARFTSARDLEKTIRDTLHEAPYLGSKVPHLGPMMGDPGRGTLIGEVEVAEVLRRIVEDVLQQMNRLL